MTRRCAITTLSWFAAGLAVLSACSPRPYGVRETGHLLNYDKFSAESIETSMAGNTVLFYDDGHGTQVEYYSPDGFAYLWYPNNKRAVPSLWKVQKNGKQLAKVCFAYPSDSFNPVTQEFGGKWECRPSPSFSVHAKAVVSGDPFELKSGRLPATLPKRQELAFEQLVALTPNDEKLQYLYKRR